MTSCWSAQRLPSGSAKCTNRPPRLLVDAFARDVARTEVGERGVRVVDHHLDDNWDDPSGIISRPRPKQIEQAEPGGVTCTKRSSGLTVVSWSTGQPSVVP